MGDQGQDTGGSRPSYGGEADQRNEPVRSRWTPKPEQILILESIFNSGMVNPPKDETVKIRKMLEKFGSVGDANVFYWFQNRRSRSRRRQRQLQASLTAVELPQAPPHGGGDTIQFDQINAVTAGFVPGSSSFYSNTSSWLVGSGSSSSSGIGENTCIPHNSHDFYSFSGHSGPQELEHNPMFCHSDASSLHYQPGVITVFINGVATEMARGPLDIKAMFGGDFVLFHSSGVPLQVNEYGFLVQSLQHGESYFLVPRHS
ncbi:WUSCHEL-related homeobox 11-like [Primulina huaijiensis]|uniref:WUSCHEL-related homeobox 11-like n=1 Tax=Primulina huaijiensis TaxID=1492673 RepID=UPI003CC769DF